MTDDQAPEVPLLADLGAALDLLELRGFRTFGVSGRRRDGGYDDVPPPEEGAELADEVEPKSREMQINFQEDAGRISVRVRIELDAPMCVVEVDMTVLYSKSEPFMMTPEVKAEFVQGVALMNLWPFIRQHVFDVSQRLDATTTIGLLRSGAGHLVLKTPAADESSAV